MLKPILGEGGETVGYEEVPDEVVEAPKKTLKEKVISVFKPEVSDGAVDTEGDKETGAVA